MKATGKITQWITGSHKSILFVGIGNVLRCDDAIGVYIVNRIHSNGRIKRIQAETSLENYVSRINQLSPDIVILVDCVNFGKKPGYCRLLRPEDTLEPVVNTHNLTLKRVSEFFTMPVYVLGIQPANLQVGETLTPEVKEAGEAIAASINQTVDLVDKVVDFSPAQTH